MKDGTYAINLDDKKGRVTYWISLFIDRSTTISFMRLELYTIL